MPARIAGRPNQKRRTRKDLLEAAARLMRQGRTPDLEEIAAEALVSRATAYRYFPSVEALLLEASLDIAIPSADDILRGAPPKDPLARLQRIDTALHEMIVANEAPLRIMLANALQRVARGEQDSDLPARQNRRTPLIEAALEPARTRFEPAELDMLAKALALVIGTEAMVVCKDVLQLDEHEASRVRHWAIGALVSAAARRRPRVQSA